MVHLFAKRRKNKNSYMYLIITIEKTILILKLYQNYYWVPTILRTHTYSESRFPVFHFWRPWGDYSIFFKKFFGVKLIYNVVLALSLQQSESVIHIHISTLFFLIWIIIEHWTDPLVLYSRSQLLIYPI